MVHDGPVLEDITVFGLKRLAEVIAGLPLDSIPSQYREAVDYTRKAASQFLEQADRKDILTHLSADACSGVHLTLHVPAVQIMVWRIPVTIQGFSITIKGKKGAG